MIRFLAVCWSLLGVTILLGFAIYRLSQHVLALEGYSLSALQWITLIGFTGFMAYSEGYKGFQKGFSPRVAARIRYLKQHATPSLACFAPFFSLGYFGTTRKRQLTVVFLTLGLALIIMLMKYVPQPWRGIIDMGVIVGLSWGLVSFYIFTWKALSSDEFNYSAELKS